MSTDLDRPPLHPTSPIFFLSFPSRRETKYREKKYTHTCLEQRWRSGDIHIVAYRVCFWHWKRMKEGDIKKKRKKIKPTPQAVRVNQKPTIPAFFTFFLFFFYCFVFPNQRIQIWNIKSTLFLTPLISNGKIIPFVKNNYIKEYIKNYL